MSVLWVRLCSLHDMQKLEQRRALVGALHEVDHPSADGELGVELEAGGTERDARGVELRYGLDPQCHVLRVGLASRPSQPKPRRNTRQRWRETD